LSSLCSSPAARALVLKEVLSAAKAAGLTSLHTPAAGRCMAGATCGPVK
jgi:hypothetical protein